MNSSKAEMLSTCSAQCEQESFPSRKTRPPRDRKLGCRARGEAAPREALNREPISNDKAETHLKVETPSPVPLISALQSFTSRPASTNKTSIGQRCICCEQQKGLGTVISCFTLYPARTAFLLGFSSGSRAYRRFCNPSERSRSLPPGFTVRYRVTLVRQER